VAAASSTDLLQVSIGLWSDDVSVVPVVGGEDLFFVSLGCGRSRP